MPPLSDDDRKKELAELQQVRNEAKHWSDYNHKWEIGFRVLVLVMSIATAVCSGIAASDSKNPSVQLSVTSTILSAVIAIVSAFAFQLFDFSGRRERWNAKASAFSELIDHLKLNMNLEVQAYIDRKGAVNGYDADRGGVLPPWAN
jgi:hypothetical protein